MDAGGDMGPYDPSSIKNDSRTESDNKCASDPISEELLDLRGGAHPGMLASFDSLLGGEDELSGED